MVKRHCLECGGELALAFSACGQGLARYESGDSGEAEQNLAMWHLRA
jgi:hypothetical protein